MERDLHGAYLAYVFRVDAVARLGFVGAGDSACFFRGVFLHMFLVRQPNQAMDLAHNHFGESRLLLAHYDHRFLSQWT